MRKLRVEYHVIDKCNLNCKSCAHFSNLVEEAVHRPLDKIKNDFARIHKLTHKGAPEYIEKIAREEREREERIRKKEEDYKELKYSVKLRKEASCVLDANQPLKPKMRRMVHQNAYNNFKKAHTHTASHSNKTCGCWANKTDKERYAWSGTVRLEDAEIFSKLREAMTKPETNRDETVRDKVIKTIISFIFV